MKHFLVALIILASFQSMAQTITGGNNTASDPYTFEVNSNIIKIENPSWATIAFLANGEEVSCWHFPKYKKKTRSTSIAEFSFESIDACLVLVGCLRSYNPAIGDTIVLSVDRSSKKVLDIHLPQSCSTDQWD